VIDISTHDEEPRAVARPLPSIAVERVSLSQFVDEQIEKRDEL
jgi:hypothetical protein